MSRRSWVVWLVRGSSAAAALALVAMMLATVVDVAMAHLFRRPIIGTYDLVETMLVVSVFLGIPATFQRNGNIVVDVVDLFASRRVVRFLKRLALALTLGFLLLLLYNMIVPALDALKFGGRKQELGLPLWALWVPILLGVLLSALVVVVALVRPPEAVDGREPPR